MLQSAVSGVLNGTFTPWMSVIVKTGNQLCQKYFAIYKKFFDWETKHCQGPIWLTGCGVHQPYLESVKTCFF